MIFHKTRSCAENSPRGREGCVDCEKEGWRRRRQLRQVGVDSKKVDGSSGGGGGGDDGEERSRGPRNQENHPHKYSR